MEESTVEDRQLLTTQFYVNQLKNFTMGIQVRGDADSRMKSFKTIAERVETYAIN